MKFRVLALVAFALAFPYTSFAGTVSAGGTSSTCTNTSSSPANGTLYTAFTCSLYNDASSHTYTFDLTPLMEEGGASLYDNLVGPGYVVVINADPITLSSNDTNDAAL